jgi:cellulose synthase/poly-beta-1,6-N-acetylglucosamine synthase-like glycosyltransferase
LLYNIYDYLLLWSLASIWLVMLINNVLVTGGFLCYLKHEERKKTLAPAADQPFVSVLIPAHNEAKVIGKTLEAILESDYDQDKFEIVVINDNSSDNSAEILERIKEDNPGRMLTIINTDKITGGKGKSNALNIGLAQSKGAFIAIYDADNTPEKSALGELVHSIVNDPQAGAVIGKFRCRNRNRNLFTRFINIEGLYFQWMAQAGRWQLLKLCTIPGTNFIIRRNILDEIGGWDTDAITEDTEISFRIYLLGYHIRFCPYSASWEQEPETLAVWFKQRKRWVKGNYYVLIKNFKYLFDSHAGPVKFDLLYFLAVYVLFLSSSLVSDVIFILGFGGFIQTTILGYSLLLWVMAYLLFILSVLIALSAEKGELKLSNVFFAMIMYFSYCKLWSIITVIGLVSYITDFVFKRQITWYKTERF